MMCVWQVEGGEGQRKTSRNWFSVPHLGPGIKCQGLRTRALTTEPSCIPFVSSLVGSLALNLRFSCLGARPMPTYSSFKLRYLRHCFTKQTAMGAKLAIVLTHT